MMRVWARYFSRCFEELTKDLGTLLQSELCVSTTLLITS